MLKIESYINDILNKYPPIKKIIKRIYQLIMYSISPKVKYEGDIQRISPKDGMEYFLAIMINHLGMLQTDISLV